VCSGTLVVTNDGVTIAKDVFLENEIEDLGARVMREISMQTNDKVGDGTAIAPVLAQAILKKGLENMGNETDVLRDHSKNPTQQNLPQQSTRARVLTPGCPERPLPDRKWIYVCPPI
jgi:hypothetical protein